MRKVRSAFHDRDLLDFLDPHRRKRRLRRIVKSLAVIGTLASVFAMIMFSTSSSFSPTAAVSKILAKRFGNGASAKSASFSWGGAELRDVKIDPRNDSRVGRAKAQIDWNPLSKRFGAAKSLELGEFDVHWQWGEVLAMLNQKKKTNKDEAAADPALSKISLTGGVLSIGPNKDAADIKLENVVGSFDRKTMSGSITAGRVYVRGKLADVDVQADVVADSKSGLSLRMKQGAKLAGWTMEVKSGEGLKDASASLKLLHPSPEFRAFLPASLSTSEGLRGNVLFKLSVESGGKELAVVTKGELEGLQLLSPDVARKELKFGKLSWNGDGRIDVLSRRVSIPQMQLRLNSQSAASGAQSAVAEVNLGVTGQIAVASGGSWQVDVEVPPSQCDEVKRAMPEGVFDVIGEEVRLSGKLNSKMKLQFQDGLSRLVNVGHPSGQFDCELEVGHPRISSLLLRSAKSLSRSPTGVWTLSRAEPATMAQAITTYDVMPEHLISAVVNAEDKRFMNHDGFDWLGLVNAFKRNLQASEFVLGGSTITQQVAKNLFLTPEKSLARKVEEAFLTWYIERALPKERIMEIYLNIAHWAPSVFGIRHAARYYFSKDPKQLDPKESVFLASILPSPDRRAKVLCTAEGRKKFDQLAKRAVSGMVKAGMMPAESASKISTPAPQFAANSEAKTKMCVRGSDVSSDVPEKSQRSQQVR